MAIYDNLPVFKASYDLLLEVYDVCEKIPRGYKYTLCEKLKDEVMEMMVDIYEANATTEKKPSIRSAKQCLVKAKLYIKLLHDLKQISTKRLASISDKTETVSKQLSSWHNSQKNI